MLNERQQKCIILMLTTNKTQKQIAKEIQVSENSISEWKKNKEFKEELQNQMKDNFGSLAVIAQKELGKLLKNKNANIRIQAIKDVLDRAGYKPTDKVDVNGNIESSSNKILESINKQLSDVNGRK